MMKASNSNKQTRIRRGLAAASVLTVLGLASLGVLEGCSSQQTPAASPASEPAQEESSSTVGKSEQALSCFNICTTNPGLPPGRVSGYCAGVPSPISAMNCANNTLCSGVIQPQYQHCCPQSASPGDSWDQVCVDWAESDCSQLACHW